MTKNNKHLPYNLLSGFLIELQFFNLAKKFTNDLTKFPQQKFGQTEHQSINLSNISIRKLHDQFSTKR